MHSSFMPFAYFSVWMAIFLLITRALYIEKSFLTPTTPPLVFHLLCDIQKPRDFMSSNVSVISPIVPAFLVWPRRGSLACMKARSSLGLWIWGLFCTLEAAFSRVVPAEPEAAVSWNTRRPTVGTACAIVPSWNALARGSSKDFEKFAIKKSAYLGLT